jgi:hypothetical protein
MYLVFALLAPIVMFGLIPGLAWFEERMLGPGAVGPKPSPTPPSAKPTAAQPTPPPTHTPAPHPTPFPLQPLTHAVAAPQAHRRAAPPPVRHHLRHTVKRGRGLHAA